MNVFSVHVTDKKSSFAMGESRFGDLPVCTLLGRRTGVYAHISGIGVYNYNAYSS